MKTHIKFSLLGLIAIIGLFAGGSINVASAAQYSVPTCTSATLHGTVTPNGATTQAWFEWGRTSALGEETAHQTFGANEPTRTFSAPITGLSPQTTYYFRAVGENSFGRGEAPIDSFQTAACTPTTYTVSTNAGQGGNITPPSQTVNSGNTASFTLTPNSGYSISNLTNGCNGNLNGNTYTTGTITSNCTVYAIFTQNQTYTVSTH